MQLAVSSYSLSRWKEDKPVSLERKIDWVADNGIKAMEFSGIEPREQSRNALLERAGEIREHCRKRDLAIAGYSIGADLLKSPADQKKEIAMVKMHVETAAALGVKSMRHDVTRGNFDAIKRFSGPRTFTQALKIVVPAIREIADLGASLGVYTTLENHGFYCQAPDRVQKIIDTTNHPNFRLTIDMGNFLCVNADPVAAVRQLAPYAVMVHAKDFHIKPRKAAPKTGWIHTPTPIAIRGAIAGHGNIDIPAQIKLVKKAGYKGFLSLEFEGLEEPRFAVLEGIAFLQSLI